jgi:hypothetical protein
MTRTRAVAAVALALLAVTAGCSGAGNDSGTQLSGGGGDGAEPERADAPATAAESGGSGGDGGDGGEAAKAAESATGRSVASLQSERLLVRNGQAEVRVDSFDEARRRLTRAAERDGGFVSDTSQQVHTRYNQSWTTGEVVLRVPSENFTAVFEAAKGVGEVQSASVETTDVTDRVVDLRARLENLRAERERLRTLYEDAEDTESVLQVQRRLSDVQGEIERTEAQLRNLENRVAFSTIRVRLAEPEPDPGPAAVPDRWYDTPLASAFLESLSGVVTVVRAIAVGAAYVAPYLVVFGSPLAAGAVLYRRRRG